MGVLIGWLVNALIWAAATMLGALAFLGADFINNALDWLWAWIQEGVSELIELLRNHLPEDWQTFLMARPWEFLEPHFYRVQYVIPLTECAVVIGTAFSILGVVQLVRWIKAFVPTVGD